MTTHEIISATEVSAHRVELNIRWGGPGAEVTTDTYSQQAAKALGWKRPDPQPVDPAWMVEVAREANAAGYDAANATATAAAARAGERDHDIGATTAIRALRLALRRGHVVLAPVMPSEEEMLAAAVEDAAQAGDLMGNSTWARHLRDRICDGHDEVKAALQARRNVYASLGAVAGKAVSSGSVMPKVDLGQHIRHAWDNGYCTAICALQNLCEGEGNATTLYANEREKDVSDILENLKSGEA